jgi:ABC-type phosphate transport system substrate-binding protein
VAVYLVVIVVLWFTREEFRSALPFGPRDPDRIVVAGMDVAPALTDDLVHWFGAKYPDVEVARHGGNSLQAMEDLLNRRCDVAFSIREPTEAENALFVEHTGDRALCSPVAVGAILIAASGTDRIDPVSLDDLRSFLLGEDAKGEPAKADDPPFPRLYVPDPNGAEWDVLLERLGIAAGDRARAEQRVTFLADASAVREAVADDPGSIGIVAAWGGEAFAGLHPLDVQAEVDGETVVVTPNVETVASGAYPLYHHLYVCCLPANRRQASVFVTLVTEGPGQRHIERAGFLPARWTAREVILTREGGEE